MRGRRLDCTANGPGVRCRFWKGRQHAVLLGAVLILSAPAWTQQPAPAEAERREPAGIRLESVSTHVGTHSFRYLRSAGDPGGSALWLVAGGAAARVAWHVPVRTTEASVQYHVGYARNQRFATLSGFDHAVSGSVRTDRGRRSVFTLAANGESRLMYNVLFERTRSPTATEEASSPDELAGVLMDDPAAGMSSSPLDVVLSGTRRRRGGVQASFAHSHSRRLTSHAGIAVARDLRASSRDPAFTSRYPPFTVGMANLGVTYLLSRRTRISGGGTYARSYSRLRRFHWQSMGMGVGREIGRRSFAAVQAGYARVVDLGTGRPGRNAYTAGAGLGTTKGYHTLVGMFRRGAVDTQGLGANSSIVVDGTWAWTRPTVPWTVATSFGYGRLAGRGLGVRTWVYHTSVARRLTSNVNLEFDVAYASIYGGGFMDFPRRGFRVGCVWTPGIGLPLGR